MINKKKGQLSNKLGKTRRNSRWIRGRSELSHHSSKTILRDNQLPENPKWWRQGVKDQGNHLFNVRVVKEIICLEIVLTEVKKWELFTNVQQVETVEDMCRNVPRIYEVLDKKKAECQSDMIEVEGMINNQTIAILIDSGSIHSYIDPKMVERFNFPRSKHGKY